MIRSCVRFCIRQLAAFCLYTQFTIVRLIRCVFIVYHSTRPLFNITNGYCFNWFHVSLVFPHFHLIFYSFHFTPSSGCLSLCLSVSHQVHRIFLLVYLLNMNFSYTNQSIVWLRRLFGSMRMIISRWVRCFSVFVFLLFNCRMSLYRLTYCHELTMEAFQSKKKS